MKKYVIDANVMLGLILTDDVHSPLCASLLDAVLQSQTTKEPVSFIAPAVIFVEVNSNFHKRRKEGRPIIQTKFQIDLCQTHTIDVEFVNWMTFNKIFEKFESLKTGDMLYAAVAYRYSLPLITTDTDFDRVKDLIKVVNLNRDPISAIL